MPPERPRIVDNGNCPFCLASGCGALRNDRKGRPYFSCIGCGTRAFIHSDVALRSFLWVLSSGRNYAALSQAQSEVASPVLKPEGEGERHG